MNINALYIELYNKYYPVMYDENDTFPTVVGVTQEPELDSKKVSADINIEIDPFKSDEKKTKLSTIEYREIRDILNDEISDMLKLESKLNL